MSPLAQQIAIAEACGVRPKCMWRVWYDAERQHGSVCIPSRHEAVERAAYEKRNAERFGYAAGLCISEPEEYDEWQDAPRYPNDLNAMREAEETLKPCRVSRGGEYPSELWGKYVFHLLKTCEARGVSAFNIPSEIRAECFLRAIDKWDDTK